MGNEGAVCEVETEALVEDDGDATESGREAFHVLFAILDGIDIALREIHE